ncbi:MAG: TIGR01777 family oxidoreductase [Acidimicrobiales bacterium]
MHVLVTGSSGLIGTALVETLVAGDHRVTRLVRPGSGLGRTPAGAPVTDVAWDPHRGTIDSAGLQAAGPFDGAVNLAGAGVGDKRWSAARKQVVLASRTDSTTLVATALAALNPSPPVLVSGSAVGYYGDRGDEIVTEESPAGTGFLAGVCVAWERAAAPARSADIRTVLLRTGIVLSAAGGALAKQLPLFRMGVGGRTGSGRQYRSWITLDDHIAAVLHCLADSTIAGPVNATAPNPSTDAGLAHALGAVLHRPSFLAVPSPVLKLALGTGMATEMILTGQRVLPEKLVASGFSFAHPELDGALRAVLVGS